MERCLFQVAQFTSRYMVTPWLTAKHLVVGIAKMFIPTQVREVIHINTDTDAVTYIHKDMFWSYNPATMLTLSQKERESGFYFIRTWDGLSRQSKEYFLSSKHLKEALGIRTLANWWTLHDYGIQVLLNGYMTYNKPEKHMLFGVFDNNGFDYAQHVHSFLRSLEIPNNVTAKALTLWLKHYGYMDPHSKDSICTLSDFELNERSISEADPIS